jgi:ABC-type uncharacterized transport system permease subunit
MAFAGVTMAFAGVTIAFAGVTIAFAGVTMALAGVTIFPDRQGLEIRLRVAGKIPAPLFYFINLGIDSPGSGC